MSSWFYIQETTINITADPSNLIEYEDENENEQGEPDVANKPDQRREWPRRLSKYKTQ